MPKKTRTIIQKVTIPATPEQVYEAFIDPENTPILQTRILLVAKM